MSTRIGVPCSAHGGYFMTEEKEAAAKWAIVEAYKKNKEHLNALLSQVRPWGPEFNKIGYLCSNNPEQLHPDHWKNLPTKDEFQAMAVDIRKTQEERDRLTSELKGIGIAPF